MNRKLTNLEDKDIATQGKFSNLLDGFCGEEVLAIWYKLAKAKVDGSGLSQEENDLMLEAAAVPEVQLVLYNAHNEPF